MLQCTFETRTRNTIVKLSSIKFIPLESLIDNSSSGSSFTRRERFICTATNFFLPFVSFPLPSSSPPTKRKKGWKQVRNIVHYVHKLWLPLPPSHTGLAPDLQPSDYRFGSFVGRCSFHSDQILPHGRSKLGKSTTCTTNEHGPSDTKRERERERERHHFRFCSPRASQKELTG